MIQMPVLETRRLFVRPFDLPDLETIHCILDVELAEVEMGSEGAKSFEERREWLQWTVLNYEQLAKLYQPPCGDRAVVLKSPGQLIGAAGLVPCLGPFGQLPYFSLRTGAENRLQMAEVGLFYAFSPEHQGQGYATEAARALIDYAFHELQLERIIATTTYDNQASMAVMRRLGMSIERNPYPDPPWLQVVGILENRPSL
jgi:RimJ/RimL family protein N-acetyltransferase